MNQRKNKKQAKRLEIKSMKPQQNRQGLQSLPAYGNIHVGKIKERYTIYCWHIEKFWHRFFG